MAIKISADVEVNIRLRPIGTITKEMSDKIIPAFVLTLQDMVRSAVQISKDKGIWLTGNNARSIGWAISPQGSSSLGPLTTTGGSTSSSGSGVSGPKNQITAILATSSGYGGWLQIGTRRFKGRDYMIQALNDNIGKLKERLTGVL